MDTLKFKVCGEMHMYTKKEIEQMKNLIIAATALDPVGGTAHIVRRGLDDMFDTARDSEEGEHLLLLYEHLTFNDLPKWAD